jgi:hypothetical protein
MRLAMNKRRQKHVDERILSVFRNLCRNSIRRHIAQRVVAEYAKANDIKVSEAVVSNMTKRFELKYAIRSKALGRMQRVDDLCKISGSDGVAIERDIIAAARYLAVTNAILHENPVTVSPEEVKRRLSRIEMYNIRVRATNDLVFAKATNIWRKVVAGEITFEDAARKHSEDIYIAQGSEWGSFSKDLLGDETELLTLLPKMKIGDITPPIQSDAGLAIIRYDSKDPRDIYTFSRVFFRLAEPFCEETRLEAESEIRQGREVQEIKRVLKNFENKLEIQYPSGTNLFSRAGENFKITPEDLGISQIPNVK